MKKLIALIAAGVLAYAPSGRADDPAQEERKLLEGVWSVTSAEENGRTASPDQFKPGVFTSWRFKGDSATLVAADEKQELKYQVDPSKEPRQLDLVFPPERTGEDEQRLTLIYERKGDDLRICQPDVRTGGGHERPTGFSADQCRVILTLTRQPR